VRSNDQALNGRSSHFGNRALCKGKLHRQYICDCSRIVYFPSTALRILPNCESRTNLFGPGMLTRSRSTHLTFASMKHSQQWYPKQNLHSEESREPGGRCCPDQGTRATDRVWRREGGNSLSCDLANQDGSRQGETVEN
jgi:hypothetical protein